MSATSKKSATGKKRPGAVSFKEFVPTDKQREMVRALAAGGWKHEDICIGVVNPDTGKPIDDKTLRKVFRKELDGAMEAANAAVVAALFRNATQSNNVAAQIFWLKTRANFREADRVPPPGATPPEGQQNTTGVLVVPGIATDLTKWQEYVAKTNDDNQRKADEILRSIKEEAKKGADA